MQIKFDEQVSVNDSFQAQLEDARNKEKLQNEKIKQERLKVIQLEKAQENSQNDKDSEIKRLRGKVALDLFDFKVNIVAEYPDMVEQTF